MCNLRVLLLVLMLVGLVGDGFAEPSKDELRAMEAKVAAESKAHQQLKLQAEQIQKELGKISVNMVSTAKKIQTSEEKLSKMESELEQLKLDLKTAEEKFAEEDENLINTLAALQNLALKPTEALFVQPLTPVEIIRSAMLLRETVPYLEENAGQLRKELNLIGAKKAQVEKQLSLISKQKIRLEKEHAQMKVLSSNKSALRKDVENKSGKAKKNMEALAGKAQDLRDLLAKIEKEQKALEAKKAEDTQTADLIKFKPEVIKDIGEGFTKAKGSLLLPAKGAIVTRFNEVSGSGAKSKGIAIKTRNLAQVVSPFDGAVIFAGPFRGYGNLIIVDHFNGYLSLLAGLDSIDCELGQMLLAGEPVGVMPAKNETKLYVEIRKDGQPIDPMSWFRRN